MDKTAALAKNVDAMQKELRRLDPLEKRVAAIERRLDKLEGKSTTRQADDDARTTTTPEADDDPAHDAPAAA